MTLARFLTVGALALTLAACAPTDKAAANADPGAKTIATVNGKKITETMLDTFVKAAAGRPASELDPESRKEAIDALIDMQVLAAEGQKQGLDKKGEAAASIELARINVLQRAVADGYLKDKTPTDQELRAEYDARNTVPVISFCRTRRSPTRSSLASRPANGSRRSRVSRSIRPRRTAVILAGRPPTAMWRRSPMRS